MENQNVQQLYEAGLLKLDNSKAKTRLGWKPRWDIETALNKTMGWHRAWRESRDMAEFTSAQVQSYSNA